MDAPNDCGIPVGSPIELRFDRYVLPSTISRSAISLYTGVPGNGIFLAPTYDVLERVVTFRPEYGSQLLPGVVYQVELTLPEKASGGSGLKAFDGAPLEKGHVPVKWSFRTSRVAVQPSAPKPLPTCNDAVQILQKSGCGRCHAGEDSTYGLDLHSGAGLANTAIGRVAHETASWASPESPLENAPRFGTAMALIAPGNPSTSYLLYKLFVNARNFDGDGACTTAHVVPLAPGECLAPPSAERTRLGDWFVAGDPMPPDGASLSGGIADLKALIAFIQSSTAQCNGG